MEAQEYKFFVLTEWELQNVSSDSRKKFLFVRASEKEAKYFWRDNRGDFRNIGFLDFQRDVKSWREIPESEAALIL